MGEDEPRSGRSSRVGARRPRGGWQEEEDEEDEEPRRDRREAGRREAPRWQQADEGEGDGEERPQVRRRWQRLNEGYKEPKKRRGDPRRPPRGGWRQPADDGEDEEDSVWGQVGRWDEEDEEEEVGRRRRGRKGDASSGQFAQSEVFEGMDDFPAGGDDPTEEELSLLYDDFEVTKKAEKAPKAAADDLAKRQPGKDGLQKRQGRKLQSLEEREYVVEAEGIAVRTLPDERSPRTGEILRQGTKFLAVEAVDGEGRDSRLYLRLPDGRGWVFDDAKMYPGLPSVRLVSVGGMAIQDDTPKPPPRPLVAIIGRPNVGKSSLMNKICDVSDVHGSITFDEPGVTRDRTYKEAEHTDDCGDTYMFEVVDTGGLIFYDDLETVTFRKEIKLQIDVALREAVACIFVVDSQSGLVEEDRMIANYLRTTYVSKGLKVVLAVAKCDRLEKMDLHCAEFWALDMGEPIPVCSLHGRGVWEVVDRLIDRGCNGLFPLKIRGEVLPPSRRETSINVAIIGKPNAGKSSLLNALVGEDRSIVSDIPGTTTDAIDAYLETEEGKTYRFIDTAGIRRSGKIKPGTEWLSVNRAIKSVKRCDVALLVLDASSIMKGNGALGSAFWCPDQQHRYIARQVEEKGAACVIVLSKWDALANKDEKSQKKFVEAIRSNLAGVGQWAEVVTCSAKTGQRLTKVLQAVDKTLAAHRKRVPTPILNEVVRDALLWRLPAAKGHGSRQGRIYYASQVSTEPPVVALFCNDPDLFNANYKTYLENKLRQDLGWFGTPLNLEWRKRTERRALSQAEEWLGPRLQPEEAWR